MARRQRGMTFLEVMIVVVILGILMALVLPNMAGPRARTALRTSARDLASAGLVARQQAIANGEKTYLILNIEEETNTWRIHISPEEKESRRSSRRDELEPMSSEEQPRNLPHLVEFANFRAHDEELSLTEEHRLVFYPNGNCTGMAIGLKNNRDSLMTVDFDPATGLPEVYKGEPKTLAQKLRERGLNPADYGLEDVLLAAEEGSRPGDGYYMSAGWSEEERINYYEDAVDRMFNRAEAKRRIAEEGVGAYYSEASRWGN